MNKTTEVLGVQTANAITGSHAASGSPLWEKPDPLRFVAHVIREPQTQKRQHHPTAAHGVVDVSLPGGGEQALGLLEGDEKDIELGGPITQHPFHQPTQPKRLKIGNP